MIITKEWIEQFKTPNGAWNSAQLKILRVSWPPYKGWKKDVAGNFLSEEQARDFERLSGNLPDERKVNPKIPKIKSASGTGNVANKGFPRLGQKKFISRKPPYKPL